jgi:hypothetical protein
MGSDSAARLIFNYTRERRSTTKPHPAYDFVAEGQCFGTMAKPVLGLGNRRLGLSSGAVLTAMFREPTTTSSWARSRRRSTGLRYAACFG